MRKFGRRAVGPAFLSILAGIWLGRASSGLGAQPEGAETIVVLGDSQAQGIAGALQRLLLDDSRFRVLNRTHPGAALVHGENEWFGPVRTFLSREKADVAVVMFGANDRLDISGGDAAGYVRFRTEVWQEAYTRRVDRIFAALVDAGLKVIWCGNPIARSDVYSNDMSYINAIYAAEAQRFGQQFFPLWELAADDQGHYAAFGKDRDGVTRRMRADDGIHFTPAGYELIAERIVGAFPAAETDAPRAP